MATGLALDRAAIAALCVARGVSRLRIFGSATLGRFVDDRSDVDFLVDFAPGSDDAFSAYFGL
ncbi:MAG: hypothetical protein LH471_12000 [Salinibacterium sp.]|nr:hypothetical protein [Salinibacterium sp.]